MKQLKVIEKLDAASGVGVGFAFPGASGYMSNVKQPENVIFTLRILYSLAPLHYGSRGYFMGGFASPDRSP